MQKFLYLLPYLFSLSLSVGILIFSWRHRFIRGAGLYSGYMMAQTLWSFGFIIELLSNTLSGKILWDSIQWVASAWVVLTVPPFVVNYLGYAVSKPKLVWGISFLVPAVFLGLLAADPWLHLIYPDAHLVIGPVFPELTYRFSPADNLFAVYGFLVSIFSIALLFRGLSRPHPLYRSQILIIIIGFMIPLVGSILTQAGLQLTPERDSSPFTFAIGNIIIAFGLFRYRLFSVVPVARTIVFESIPDFVVVVDNQNRIIDLNPSAVELLKIAERQIIGHPLEELTSRWPDLIERYRFTGREKRNEEFIFENDQGESLFFQVEVSPIIDWRKRLVGRIFVGRDIRESKKLELVLRDMASELEERVRERTRELAEAYDITLEGWARALELRDKETEGHSRSVTELAVNLARQMNLPEQELIDIRRGALLHDIGKMGIPDDILRKPGPLTAAERKIVEGHPETARRLLEPIAYLQRAIEIPYYHHEHWDGSGYPSGLKGDQIPLSARIFAVVDVWDAMRRERPYHPAYLEVDVLVYIREQSGKHFDPEVVVAFLQLLQKTNTGYGFDI